LATHLYRIAQEAVNNAVKHGKARKILIRLAPEGKNAATLLVRDDGVGFDQNASSAGMGLGIMRYRASVIAASLEVNSTPKGRTEVRCTFKYRL
jgi:signal transduction histidine kinase